MRPRSSVSVPGDVFAGVTREQAELGASCADQRADDIESRNGVFGEVFTARYRAVAAALRRLAPYLPPEPRQEAVQAGDGREATP